MHHQPHSPHHFLQSPPPCTTNHNQIPQSPPLCATNHIHHITSHNHHHYALPTTFTSHNHHHYAPPHIHHINSHNYHHHYAAPTTITILEPTITTTMYYHSQHNIHTTRRHTTPHTYQRHINTLV